MATGEDKCYGHIRPEDQEAAADAVLANMGWDEKFTCMDCGALVGAERSPMGNFYVPHPRPHDKPKRKAQPSRKQYPGGKRV